MADENGLGLFQWAEHFGLSPWRVAGFGDKSPDCGGQANCCDGTWFEYAHQRDQLARRDVIFAIQQAELEFSQVVGYWPSPVYTEGEKLYYPQSGHSFHNGSGLKTIVAKYGKLIQAGQKVCTKIGDATVTLTSPLNMEVSDGADGLNSGTTVEINDSFTATRVVPAGTLASELRFYHTEAARLGEPKEEWPIQGLKVSVSGTTATISGRSWHLANPAVQMRTDCEELDPTSAGSFVTAIEVWRCTVDACEQGHFIYLNSGCATPPCASSTYPFCTQIIDDREGRLAPYPADCDEDDVFQRSVISECAAPDRVSLNYVSGIPFDAQGRMERGHARIIALLAASYLDCTVCACDCTKKRLEKYAEPPKVKISEGRSGPQDDRFKVVIPGIGPSSIPDPEFGLNWGAVVARRMAMPLRIRLGTTSDAVE